jgi:signal transduction histidine kinase
VENVETGLRRAQRFMVLATCLYRASHLAVGILAVVQHQRAHPVQWAVLAVALAGSALLYGQAWSRGWFAGASVWADTAVVGCALPVVSYLWGGARTAESIAWVMLLGGSSSAVAAIALPRWHAAAAVVLLALSHLAGYRAVEAGAAVTGGHLNALASSALLAGVFWRYLCRQGTSLDAANARAVAAEAHRARYAERIAHHRALHDTVLATLTTIARGGVDANSPQVRLRCAQEAAYLRRLVERGTADDPDAGIAAALERAVRSAESLALRVTTRYHGLSHGLSAVPGHVATAVADAVTEALNNVRRHAGTGHAYVTVTGGGDRGGVRVTVVDRGRGFDPAAAAGGIGLVQSVHARMREIGGRADVDSAPGEGARVALEWPA